MHVLTLKRYFCTCYFMLGAGNGQSFCRVFFGAGINNSRRLKTAQPGQFDRHEANHFVGAARRLPGTQDIARDALPSFPPLGDRPPSDRIDRADGDNPACQAILGDVDPGGIMARAQPPTQKGDDEGATQSADGRVDQGHDDRVGRLRPAHVRPPPPSQCFPAQVCRGHHQAAVAWPEVPPVQAGCLQRRCVCQR